MNKIKFQWTKSQSDLPVKIKKEEGERDIIVFMILDQSVVQKTGLNTSRMSLSAEKDRLYHHQDKSARGYWPQY
jgi:hypothetical protein